MIEVFFRGTDRRLEQALARRRAQLVEVVSGEMDRVMFLLLRRVQQKLSGEVLTPRSGGRGLLGSARKEPTQTKGGRIVGRVTVGGGLASVYPAVQEYGGRRVYDIYPGAVTGKSDKKALAFFGAGSPARGGAPGRQGPLYAIGRKLRYQQGVRRGALRPGRYGDFAQLGGIVVTHVVHPPLPARSYLRSSQAELRAEIEARLRVSVRRALS